MDVCVCGEWRVYVCVGGGCGRVGVCGEGCVCMCVILTISEPVYLKRQA